MKALRETGYALGLPVLLIAIWWVIATNDDGFFSVMPSEVAVTFIDVWFDPQRLVADVIPSLVRLLIGLAIAIVLGVAVGIIIGLSSRLRMLAEPVFEFFRAVPPPMLTPILLLVFGIGDLMKLILIIVGSVWPILLNTVEGVRATDSVQRETAVSYGFGKGAQLRYLVLPSSLPQIMAGIRQALPIALILMIISEMIASFSGIGFSIIQFQKSFQIPEMWSGVFLLGFLGILLAFVFQFTERRVLRWYHGLKEAEHE